MPINSFDDRLIELNDLFASYSLGDFDKTVDLSDNLDEIDSILSGVNMLGEELKERTVSRDLFSNVFNSVKDIILVMDLNNHVQMVNIPAAEFVKLDIGSIMGMPLHDLISKLPPCDSNLLDLFKGTQKEKLPFEAQFRTPTSPTIIEGLRTKVKNQAGEFVGTAIVMKDVTESRRVEKRILKTIVSTQEAEQARVANDLHDSMGQELSTIKLLLSNVSSKIQMSDPDLYEVTRKCADLIDNSIADLRNICFDLVPSVLDDGNLVEALKQLCNKLSESSGISIDFKCSVQDVLIDQDQKLAIYRVTQEFMNNTMKHAKATEIAIDIDQNTDGFYYIISDDGVGFAPNDSKDDIGRGLNTMKKRIEILNGTTKLRSKLGVGTVLTINF